jgi:hypothetical protein
LYWSISPVCALTRSVPSAKVGGAGVGGDEVDGLVGAVVELLDDDGLVAAVVEDEVDGVVLVVAELDELFETGVAAEVEVEPADGVVDGTAELAEDGDGEAEPVCPLEPGLVVEVVAPAGLAAVAVEDELAGAVAEV